MRRGFSLVELLVVVGIIAVILTIALPRYRAARAFARETTAAEAMATLEAAQIQYRDAHGHYAASLHELGPGAAGLIGSALAKGTDGDYNFRLTADGDRFVFTAAPVSGSGRSFFIDQTLTLRMSEGSAPATEKSPEFHQ